MRDNIETLKQWLKRNPEGQQRMNRLYESFKSEQRRLSKQRNNKY